MVRGSQSSSSAGYGGDLQAQAQSWVEDVTGSAFVDSFEEELRDGRRLCELINKIKPGAVARINGPTSNKWKQMENTSAFLKACRSVGVPEHSLFETVDLFESKDIGLVVRCLHALGGTAQLECPDFCGPHLGLKPQSRVSPHKKPPGAAAAAKTWSTSSPSAGAAKTWSTTPSPGTQPPAAVAFSPSPPAQSWSTPSSGRPAAATAPKAWATSPRNSLSGATSAGSSASSSPHSSPAAAEPPPPPLFSHVASAPPSAGGGGGGESEAAPPPPYDDTAQRWGSGQIRPTATAGAAATAAGPPSASRGGGRRLPPPAYREDLSSRFAESTRIADSSGSGASVSQGTVGVGRGTPQAPRPPSPPYRPPTSSGFSRQQERSLSRSPVYGGGMSASVAAVAAIPAVEYGAATTRPQSPPYRPPASSGGSQQQAQRGRYQSPAHGGVASALASTLPAGDGRHQARPRSPVRMSNKVSPSAAAPSFTVTTPRQSQPVPPSPATAAMSVSSPSVTSTAAHQQTPSAGRGGGYGLDAELAARREANYDYDAEAEAREWIEDVTGSAFIGGFGEELRDGRRLCELINRIKPGIVRKVNESKMPFKQMENISNFLKACRSVGVAEHSLFETVDLYEDKDLGLVVRCLHALGQTVQNSCPDYIGPRLGVRQTEANKREWTAEQQRQQMLNSSGVISQLMAGSSKTMERGAIIKSGVTFGAAQAGTGDRSATSGWTMGSAGTMDRAHIEKRGPTYGAEYAGASGDTSGMSSRFTGGRR